MEAQKDCLVRAISKDGFVNAVAVYTRGLTERARQIHHTSPVATAALGRALAACSMMATHSRIMAQASRCRSRATARSAPS